MTRDMGVRHLYVHLPFCVHRCGYCDFVTVVGREDQRRDYVDALLAELARESESLADVVDTIFVGGGTPTFTEPDSLRRVLAALPSATEVTVEANPETVTRISRRSSRRRREQDLSPSPDVRPSAPHRARACCRFGRRPAPFHTLRDASFDNISLDLIYGIPARGPPISTPISRRPSRLRRTPLALRARSEARYAVHARLGRRARAPVGGDGGVLRAGGRNAHRRRLSLVRDCELLPLGSRATGRDLRAHHNLGYWQGRDYLGVGIGAVSTLGDQRRRNGSSIGRYVEALRDSTGGGVLPRELEQLEPLTKAQERIMLGLRLDEPLALGGLEHAIDRGGLERMVAGGLAVVHTDFGTGDEQALSLTDHGRFLGGGVTAELLA